MARLNTNKPTQNGEESNKGFLPYHERIVNALDAMLPKYFKVKEELNVLKKESDALNDGIKEEMLSQKVNEYHSEGIKALMFEQDRSSFNEALLLNRIRELAIDGIIKTREYVDMDALENAIYTGEVDPGKLVDCKESKSCLVLKISKEKGEK